MTPILRRTARLVLVLGLACAAAASSWAGGLSVLPTRLEFAAGRSVQSVMLTNLSAQTVTVETQVLVWPDGAQEQLASDVVVTPAVVTLAPDERVRVRVGLVRSRGSAREAAYRLYFTELPAPASLLGAGIGVRLRVGIPVFVPPPQPAPRPLQWSMRPAGTEGGGWELVARNDGNVHTRIAALQLDGIAEPLAAPSPYVLAHSTLVVPLPHRPGAADSTVRWHEGSGEREAAVAPPR